LIFKAFSSIKRFKLIILLGPTAVGKTGLGLTLASELGCDIISADSRQIYREMNIGTAKPTEKEQFQVKHHLIDHRSVHDYYSAGKYEQDALQTIDQLSSSHRTALLVGGSGLYIQAVYRGIDAMPEPDLALRKQLVSRLEIEGLESLATELKTMDPESWREIDIKNPKRVIRALEVIHQTSEKFSSIKKRMAKRRSFDYIKIGLELDRNSLYERINQRADRMLRTGLLEEALELFPYRHLTALQTVGYQEFFGHLEGLYDLNEAIRLFKRNTRRYAKKQISWFKKDHEVQWFDPGEVNKIRKVVYRFLNS
jgi:tRNA dimethylallyltransferase